MAAVPVGTVSTTKSAPVPDQPGVQDPEPQDLETQGAETQGAQTHPGDSGRGLEAVLTAVARLTPAQQALLRRLAAHTHPVTVSELARESELHVSSVRETLDALLELGLAGREQLPAAGRGRPSLGYTSFTPADPTFPAQMLTQITGSVFSWLRETVPDPASAAYRIGRGWGERALAAMNVPDHARGAPVPANFQLNAHLDKARMFLTAFGFAASVDPDNDTALVLNGCPFTDPHHPDPLALEMRRGMVERVMQLTATDLADVDYVPDPVVAVRCTVVLTERPSPHRRQLVTSIRYYGGAAEAAGCRAEQLDPGPSVDTLGGLVEHLASVHPDLAPVLAVSSFFVDQKQAGRDDPVHDGSLVDVLPPFAGG